MAFFKAQAYIFRGKASKYKEKTGQLFLYRKWIIIFQPAVIIVLIISAAIFYFGIKEHSLRRAERFRFIITKIIGVEPEEITYVGGGQFTISAQRQSLDRQIEPLIIKF